VADVFGTTVENIVGKTDADFSPNVAEIEHFRRIDLEVMDKLKEQYIAEETITTVSGKILWLQTVKRPILDENGIASQILGSATDITRRREAEFELALRRNELAHLSRVAMLGELSGSLAHELNQPLTAILSNAQAAQRFLARDNPDLNEVREILQDIVNDDKRAGEVIRGLRLLLTKGQMQRQPLDLNHVVSDVLRLVRSDLLNSGVIVNTDLLPGLPAATGDRVQLQQVMINLVVNGCEAMTSVDSAARQLAVRTALTADGEVCVSVSDLGHGIPLHNLERVFDPFFTTKTHGLGLGLAVCRTIVAAQGGRLWAANNTGRGASFHFTLPAVSRTA
jgi:two-component system sensor kinase FixL